MAGIPSFIDTHGIPMGVAQASFADDHGCLAGTDAAGSTFAYVRAQAAGGSGTRAAPFDSIGAALAANTKTARLVVCVGGDASAVLTEFVGDADINGNLPGQSYAFIGGFDAAFAHRALASLSHIQAPSRTRGVFRFGNDHDVTVDGFDITGGATGIEVGGWESGRKLVIRRNHVHDNWPTDPDYNGDGSTGGINVKGVDILIQDNTIAANKGGRFGGGIYAGPATGVPDNTLDLTGTIPRLTQLAPGRVTIANNVIAGNQTRGQSPHGAGIGLTMNALVQHNLIDGNQSIAVDPGDAEGVGGGIMAFSAGSDIQVLDNWIIRNVARRGGSGVYMDEGALGRVAFNVIAFNEGIPLKVDAASNGATKADTSVMYLSNNTVAFNKLPDAASPVLAIQSSAAVLMDNVFIGNGSDDDIELGLTDTGGRVAMVAGQRNVLTCRHMNGAQCVVSFAGAADQALAETSVAATLPQPFPLFDAGAAWNFAPASTLPASIASMVLPAGWGGPFAPAQTEDLLQRALSGAIPVGALGVRAP